MRLHFTNEWLKRKIESDPDTEIGAGWEGPPWPTICEDISRANIQQANDHSLREQLGRNKAQIGTIR